MKRLFLFVSISVILSSCTFYSYGDIYEKVEVVRYHSPRVENVFQRLVKHSPEVKPFDLKLVVVEIENVPEKMISPCMYLKMKQRPGAVIVTTEIFDAPYYFLPFAVGHEIGHAFVEKNKPGLSARQKERYADVVGLQIALNAKYNGLKMVRAACKYFRSIDQLLLSRNINPYHFNNTHPSGTERCTALMKWYTKNK